MSRTIRTATLVRSLLWLLGLTLLVGVLSLGGLIMASSDTASTTFGPLRRQAIEASRQWDKGQERFVNTLPKHAMRFWPMLQKMAQGTPNPRPEAALPLQPRTAAEFQRAPASGLRVTWLGHSTSLVEIDGARVLLDPVWSERSSPFAWAGPKRFHAPPLPMRELLSLPLDAVAISHDHYDHLDRATIEALRTHVPLFVVPLGVGAYLEQWGVAAERIVELDWWERTQVGSITLVATPARHFSGRSLVMVDQDRTLWSGWALLGREHRVYYSGDTAMFPGFADIGERLGPFDLTLIETGAYDALWADVHLGPEQALLAHTLVRGRVYMPVHWGTFDLANHAWTEPVERAIAAAEQRGVSIRAPRPGASVEPGRIAALERWWPAVGWQRAEQAPIVSSGLPAWLTEQLHPGERTVHWRRPPAPTPNRPWPAPVPALQGQVAPSGR